jgi:hypothetical protein
VDGLVGGDIGLADPGVERVEILLEQAVFDLELQAATCSDSPVFGQADLARHADVELHGHG